MEANLMNVDAMPSWARDITRTIIDQPKPAATEAPLPEQSFTAVPGANTSMTEAFYSYQQEPWLTETGYESVRSRLEYVERKKSFDQIHLALIQITYSQFRDHLTQVDPDIAKKNFGFTLGPDANLKVLNYANTLTEVEKSTVEDLINNFQDLKLAIQHQARDIMILADHDHETFGSARNVTLENFHSIIDYHKILSCGRDGMQAEWIRQVSNHAEPKTSTYISEDI